MAIGFGRQTQSLRKIIDSTGYFLALNSILLIEDFGYDFAQSQTTLENTPSPVSSHHFSKD